MKTRFSIIGARWPTLDYLVGSRAVSASLAVKDLGLPIA